MSEPAPLTSEQRAALDAARARLRKLMRPARIARANGWTIGVFGGLSVAWALVNGGEGLLMGLALTAIAWNELRGAKRLRVLDPTGAQILGSNQLILALVIALYCAVKVAQADAAPEPSLKEIEDAAGFPAELVVQLTQLIYGGTAVIVGVVQVLLARYHFGAKGRIETFRRDTPGWILALLQGAA